MHGRRQRPQPPRGDLSGEVEAGFEPACAALQAATWPLGHSTRGPRRSRPSIVSNGPPRGCWRARSNRRMESRLYRRRSLRRAVTALCAWATGSSRREWSMMESLRVGIRVPDVEQARTFYIMRSEEHTSELQSRGHLVCRLLLEKKKTEKNNLVANRLNLNSS